jgi:hypothetical protein
VQRFFHGMDRALQLVRHTLALEAGAGELPEQKQLPYEYCPNGSQIQRMLCMLACRALA